MPTERNWCRTCGRRAMDSCGGHDIKRLGVNLAVDICVTDRQHTLTAGDGYYNMVGHSAGRTVAQQEAHTRKRIEHMRKVTQAKKRERRVSLKGHDDPMISGGIPSALLFSYMRKYGHDYVQHVEEFMRREGLYWGK